MPAIFWSILDCFFKGAEGKFWIVSSSRVLNVMVGIGVIHLCVWDLKLNVTQERSFSEMGCCIAIF